MEIEGRVLDPPNVTYKSTPKGPSIKPDKGAWNLAGGTKFHTTMPLNKWAFVSLCGERFAPRAQMRQLMSQFTKALRDTGISVGSDPELFYAQNNRDPRAIVDVLTHVANQLRNQGNPSQPPQLIMVLYVCFALLSIVVDETKACEGRA